MIKVGRFDVIYESRYEMIYYSETPLCKNAYLIYTYKGDVVIRKGTVMLNRTFVPDDKPRTRMTKLHPSPLMMRYGKIWTTSADYIETAIDIILDRRKEYERELEERLLKIKSKDKNERRETVIGR